jgi:vacuolar-type H+-ATPase subunit F/Vma7
MAFHIIGDRDTILGFQFAGVAGAPVASAAEAQAAFRQALDRANCRVLILTEQVGEWLAAEAAAHRLTAAPRTWWKSRISGKPPSAARASRG